MPDRYEHATEAGPEATAATCRAEGILFLVFAKHSSMVKVKNVLRREEEEVARHDLAEYLALRIQEQHRIDMQSAGSSSGATRLTKESGGHGTVGVVSSGAFGLLTGSKSDNTMIAPPECELVLPERPFDRSKKGEKNNDRRTKLSHKQLLLDKGAVRFLVSSEVLQLDTTPNDFHTLSPSLRSPHSIHPHLPSSRRNPSRPDPHPRRRPLRVQL